MAPLKLSEEKEFTSDNEVKAEDQTFQALQIHPEAYKVNGPAPEKKQPVPESLRKYASGLYGLL